MAMKRKHKETNLNQGSTVIVAFNVSGITTSTTLETLEKEPNSLLYAMATGKVDCPKDSKRRLLIKRDTECFAAIIEYLRTGLFREGDPIFLTSLHAEARYFEISSLARELEDRMNNRNNNNNDNDNATVSAPANEQGNMRQEPYTDDLNGNVSLNQPYAKKRKKKKKN